MTINGYHDAGKTYIELSKDWMICVDRKLRTSYLKHAKESVARVDRQQNKNDDTRTTYPNPQNANK